MMVSPAEANKRRAECAPSPPESIAVSDVDGKIWLIVPDPDGNPNAGTLEVKEEKKP